MQMWSPRDATQMLHRDGLLSMTVHFAPSDPEIVQGARPFTRCGLCIFAGLPGTKRRKQAMVCWTNVWEGERTPVTCKNCLAARALDESEQIVASGKQGDSSG